MDEDRLEAQVMRVRRWVCAVALLVIATTAALWHDLGEPHRSVVPAGSHVGELPPLAGAPRLASSGRSQPIADLADTIKAVRGWVLRRSEGGDVAPAGAGVRVRCFAGERLETIASAWTDADGRFALEGGPSEAPDGLESDVVRGYVAEDVERGECSAPVFGRFAPSRRPHRPTDEVRLVLRPGVRIAGRLVDSAGRPVAGGECLVRWLGNAGVRHWVVMSDADGSFSLVAPPGRLHLRGRTGPGGGLGPAVEMDASDGLPSPALRLVVGGRGLAVCVRMVSSSGMPLPEAFAVMRSEELLHVVAGPASRHIDSGGVRADASGTITIHGVSPQALPFEVGLGAPGHLARRWTVSPPTNPDPCPTIVLEEKAIAYVTIVDPNGEIPVDLDVELAVGVDPSTTAFRPTSMMRSTDVIELANELVVPAEAERVESPHRWRLALAPGGCELRLPVPGIAPLYTKYVAERPTAASAPAELALRLPPGRAIRLRAGFPEGDTSAVPPWRVTVSTHSTHPGGEPDDRPIGTWPWEPSIDARDLVVWCPMEGARIRVSGATLVDLPVRAVDLSVPSSGSAPLLVALSASGAGELQIAHDFASVPAASRVTFEVLAREGPLGRCGIRYVVADDRGAASILLPPGEYVVGRDRTEGDPAWQRVHVYAGTVSRVRLGP